MVDETQARLQALATQIKAATVAIVVKHPPEGKTKRSFSFVGSGFCVHKQGVIVTSAHILEPFYDKPPCVIFYYPDFANSPRLHIHMMPVLRSTVLGSAKGDPLDVALLRIGPPQRPEDYPVLTIADHAEVHELMDVITCGFPMGNFMMDEVGNITSSFSKGIVSSIIPWVNAPIDQLKFLQLDIRVAVGNSGGPVVSLSSGRAIAVLKGGIERKTDKETIQFQARSVPLILLGTAVQRMLAEPTPQLDAHYTQDLQE